MDSEVNSTLDDIRAIRLREVAREVGNYAPDTIEDWVRKGKFPPPFVASPGSPKLWLVKDVRAWIEKRKRSRNTKPAPRGFLRKAVGRGK